MTGAQQLELYRDGVSTAACGAGETRSRQADANGFDEALGIIAELADSGATFGADDVRVRMHLGSPSCLGAAFSAAAREGLISVAGVSTARAVSRHKSLSRVWRGVQP